MTSYRLSPATDNDTPVMDMRNRARLLVVEDDMHLIEGIQEILELDGYEVITASSGVEGLEVLENLIHPPDLIISDIMMPKMSGYEFFEAVRARSEWLTIPFIFLTAKGEKSDIRLGKAMGADDYVTKPFGAEDLLVAVSSKLERTRQIQSVLSNQVSDVKTRILTILNHEFRTPLTYVVAYSDMLRRDADQLSLQEMHEFLKGVSAGAERLQRLIENFILLVELETGEIQNTYKWRKKAISNYREVIDRAIKKIRTMEDRKFQEIEVQIASDIPAIEGDTDYIMEALARLIDNAAKFCPERHPITIHVYADDNGRPTIAVQDRGRGIPENELEQIFQVFYQIDRQRYEDQGAGSGLAIVKGLAELHHAEITVDTAAGEGSTFRLHFPPKHEGNQPD
jgi:signal transduction histidine kinase